MSGTNGEEVNVSEHIVGEPAVVKRKIGRARFIGVRMNYDKFRSAALNDPEPVQTESDKRHITEVWIGKLYEPGTEVPEYLDYLDIASGEYDEFGTKMNEQQEII